MKQHNSRKVIFDLVTMLRENNLTVSFAESVTCGMAAHLLNTVPGTKDVLRGSIVCYHESVKTTVLDVKKNLIDKHTAESAEVTDALAEGLRKVIDSDIHVAVTGLSTIVHEHKLPKGTLFVTILFKGKSWRYKKLFKGAPLELRKKFCLFIYKELISIVKNNN